MRFFARMISIGFWIYAVALLFSSSIGPSLVWFIVGIVWLYYHEKVVPQNVG